MSDRWPTLLYVDDQAENLETFRALFEGAYDVRTASSGAAAIDALSREPIAVLLTDQRMPEMSGNRLLERVSGQWPTLVTIVITAYPDPDLILEAIRAGHVYDYIIKPWDLDRLRRTVEQAVDEHERRRRHGEVLRDRTALEAEVLRRYDPSQVVGVQGGLSEAWAAVCRAAPTDSTVLLLGETGTGKEMIARAIHARSLRSHRALVKVDCAALPPTLVENELFGHEPGAFTGAVREQAGPFELASGGTIFLDEVAELTTEMQARLLRVLQDRVVERLGGTKPIPVDVRVIAASSRDLEAAIAAGAFREDLYYRLCVVPIVLPPLRERCDDILPLTHHFLAKHGRRSLLYQVDEQAMSLLQAYSWPGNVRELENLVERAVVMGAGPQIRAADLPLGGRRPSVAPPSGREEMRESARRRGAAKLQDAVQRAGGNLTAAARLLGIPRSTLLYRMRKRRVP